MRWSKSAPISTFLLAVSLLVTGGGCASPAPAAAAAAPAFEPSSVPYWAGEAMSWSKLNSIRAWQATASTWTMPYWRTEAELQLAEGRLAFAENDSGGSMDRGAVRERMLAAHAGFERVLADHEATEGQRARAQRGLDACRGSLAAPARSSARAVVSSPAIVMREQWNARAARPLRMKRNTRAFQRITIHHSAMSHPTPLSGSLGDSAAAIRRIQKAHMDSEGYGDIGYHFLIDPFGRVLQGRELTWQGAHAGGSNNERNIGICLIGNFDNDHPTPESLAALEGLLATLRGKYSIPAQRVVGHCDLKSTNCPGTHLRKWVGRYKARAPRS